MGNASVKVIAVDKRGSHWRFLPLLVCQKEIRIVDTHPVPLVPIVAMTGPNHVSTARRISGQTHAIMARALTLGERLAIAPAMGLKHVPSRPTCSLPMIPATAKNVALV
mmetsp:Transcript_32947/g.79703  ORF Transcript_32947/g.79703 Transcript_32947/m.79703 type:complete len:109 (-) Transcript_32947:305-631(-)